MISNRISKRIEEAVEIVPDGEFSQAEEVRASHDNKVQKSWFHGQDFHEYDPREIEYSAAVAAAAFAISLTEEAEADRARKIKVESQRSMARVKSFKEGPLTRLGSFRSLSIKEDTDPGYNNKINTAYGC
ncbi:hypothetical protein LINGRAHAP2_LOCUS9622 [Linum grandiflorum]